MTLGLLLPPEAVSCHSRHHKEIMSLLYIAHSVRSLGVRDYRINKLSSFINVGTSSTTRKVEDGARRLVLNIWMRTIETIAVDVLYHNNIISRIFVSILIRHSVVF
jgi:hypothetical protein